MTEYALREGLRVQLAMWADEHLFGHGLPDAEYESQCAQLASAISDDIYDTLLTRPVR